MSQLSGDDVRQLMAGHSKAEFVAQLFETPSWEDLEAHGLDPFNAPIPYVPFGSCLDKVVQDIIEGRRKA